MGFVGGALCPTQEKCLNRRHLLLVRAWPHLFETAIASAFSLACWSAAEIPPQRGGGVSERVNDHPRSGWLYLSRCKAPGLDSAIKIDHIPYRKDSLSLEEGSFN